MKRNIRTILSLAICIVMIVSAFPLQSLAAVKYNLGDTDLNGKISAEDARVTLRFAVCLESYTNAHLKIADVDKDSKITASDARLILRASVGLETLSGTVKVGDSDFSTFVFQTEEAKLFARVPPAEPTVSAPSGSFVFTVYGNGHGLGLSQYGAVALDNGGWTYDKIVTHYFTDTQILNDEAPPMYTTYCGEKIDTFQLVARIVYQEIYGITNGGKNKEAIKAQAVCIYTMLKYYNFSISSKWTAGVCSSKSYSSLPKAFKDACMSVAGQYLSVKGDKKQKPILSVFAASVAGRTADNTFIWGTPLSYLQSVESPFDMKISGFVTTKILTKSQLYNYIASYGVSYSDNPANWVQILSHTGSVDENRGYVTSVKIGNTIVSNAKVYSLFHDRIGLNSSCFTVKYIP